MESIHQRYISWATSVAPDEYSPISQLLRILPFCDLATRKTVIDFCRVQPPYPIKSTRFYRRLLSQLQRVIYVPPPSTSQSVIGLLDPLPRDIYVFGIVIEAAICAPILEKHWAESAIQAGVNKELSASSSAIFANLDYSAWFSLEHWNRDPPNPIHPGVDTDHAVLRMISSSFANVRRKLEGRILYPKMSMKNIGRSAQEFGTARLRAYRREGLLNDCAGFWEQEIRTIQDVERFYSRTGEKLEGPNQMGWVWLYYDVKPRVFYKMGSTAYHQSKYVQPIFNVLLDEFQSVHRRNRFTFPLGRSIPEGCLMAIYDYISFTSLCGESNRFLIQLSQYFKGIPVHILDSHRGLVQTDLGDILADYLNIAFHGQFDVSQMEEEKSERFREQLWYHLTGMLGVPGNIGSCTLLHGLVLSCLISSLFNSRCVGDDAFVLLGFDKSDSQAWINFMWGVNLIGNVEPDKAESWGEKHDGPEHSWKYVKRPLFRLDGLVCNGQLLVYPCLENILDLNDGIHLNKSSSTNHLLSLHTYCRQVSKFYTDVVTLQIENGSSLGLGMAVRYLEFGYAVFGIDTPKVELRGRGFNKKPLTVRTKQFGNSNVWAVMHNSKHVAYLPIPVKAADFGLDIPSMMSDGTLGLVEIPAYDAVGVEIGDSQLRIRRVERMYPHPVLSLLRYLGYIEMKEVMRKVTADLSTLEGQMMMEVFSEVLRGKDRCRLYDVEVVEELPEWFENTAHFCWMQFTSDFDPGSGSDDDTYDS